MIMDVLELKKILEYSPETGRFKWKIDRLPIVSGDWAGTIRKDNYVVIKINGKQYKAHRLAWLYVYGEWPTQEIDHINRIKNDNRICNLREATRNQNVANGSKRKTNTSGIVGVSWFKVDKVWVAYIRIDSKTIHLGRYKNIFDAACARRSAEQKYFREFSPGE